MRPEPIQRTWRQQPGEGSRIPHDLDAEKEALAILLVHPEKLAEQCARSLESEHFYELHHQAILRAVRELGPDREAADFLSVAEQIRANGDMGRLTAHGDVQYLITLANGVESPDGLAFLCRRLGIKASARAAVLATSMTLFQSAADRVPELWSQPAPRTIATGIAPLDLALEGGFLAESMAVLCAGTGRGKTGLVIQIARHWLQLGLSVLFIETELSERQITARFLAQSLTRPWREIFQTGPSGGAALSEHARRELSTLCIWKWELGQRVTELIDGYAQSLGKPPLVVIDQISDLARAKGVADMRHATASVSAEIKAAAERYKTVVLAVSQTARAVTSDPDKRKAGRSFEGAAKDAGEVEADAGTLLYLEALPSPRKGVAQSRIHIAKSRGGPCGEVVPLCFHGAQGLFEAGEGLASGTDEEAVLAAIRAQAANGKPASVALLKSATNMGQGRILAALTTLASSGQITRDPRAGIHLQRSGEAH